MDKILKTNLDDVELLVVELVNFSESLKLLLPNSSLTIISTLFCRKIQILNSKSLYLENKRFMTHPVSNNETHSGQKSYQNDLKRLNQTHCAIII